MKHETIDADGNTIRRGMMAISNGERWIVGYVSDCLIRLDKPDRSSCRIFGKRRFCCIHVVGFLFPTVFS